MTFTNNDYAPEDPIYECERCGEKTTEVKEIRGQIFCIECSEVVQDLLEENGLLED